MKKYLLFLILGFITLLPGVNADIIDCSKNINLFDEKMESGSLDAFVGNPLTYVDNSNSARSSNLISVKPNTNYYFSSNYSFGNAKFMFLDENQFYISGINTNRTKSFLTPANAYYLIFVLNSYAINSFWDSYNNGTAWAQIEEGTSQSDYIRFEACSVQEPDKPIANNSLTDFYSIYLEKLGMISNFALENKFLLSMVGIILLFAVLEIVFSMFRFDERRRYR